MTSTVLLRADADERIGIGHVMRCLALAQALATIGVRPLFVCRPLPESLGARLLCEPLPLKILNEAAGTSDEAAETAGIARAAKASRAVIDGYHLGRHYLGALRRHGLRCAVIDDFATDCAPDSVLTLNQNVFAPPARPAEGYFAGLHYALLRCDLVAGPGMRRTPDRGRLLVTLGGADPDAVTERALAACADVAGVTAIDVVVGAANPREAAIERAAGLLGPRCRVHRDVPSLAPLLARAELAIVAAGGTMWEALHWGVPMITIHRDEVQKRSTDVLMSRGLAVADVAAATATPERLTDAMRAALRDPDRLAAISHTGRATVDGRGAARIAAAIAAM